MSSSDVLTVVYAVPLGRNAAVASQSVVIASDQSNLKFVDVNAAYGVGTSATSQRVVIASDQAALNVRDTNLVYGVGAGTAAQRVVIASDQSNLKFVDVNAAYGVGTSATSQRVVIASDQAALNVRDTNLVYGVGAGTAAQRVVIASDQSNLKFVDVNAVYGSGAGNTAQRVVLASDQSTINVSDAGRLTAGQKTSAASYPVVLASDHSPLNVTNSSIVLGAGPGSDAQRVVLASDQSTINVSDAGRLTAGQKTSVGSYPVVLASDHSDIKMAGYDSRFNKQIVGNARDSFRDDFNGTTLDSNKWTVTESSQYGDIIIAEGNAAGSSWLRITKPAVLLNENLSSAEGLMSDQTSITSKVSFNLPARFMVGLSMSQRILGQEFAVELVSVDPDTGVIESFSGPGSSNVQFPLASGNVTKATSLITLNFLTNHTFSVGDRCVILNCDDNRLNHLVTVSSNNSPTQIVVSSTLASVPDLAMSATGGSVRLIDSCGNAAYCSTLLLDQTNSTNGIYATRSGGGPSFISAYSTFGTNFTQALTPLGAKAFTYAYQPAFVYENAISSDHCTYTSQAIDSRADNVQSYKRSQSIPDVTKKYAVRVRACNLPVLPVGIGRIVSISKTGSTTATVTTDFPHGLAAGNYVSIFGTKNQTDFPNTNTAVTVVLSTPAPTANTFAVVMGTTTPTTTLVLPGGGVFIGRGGVLPPVQPGFITAVEVLEVSGSNPIMNLTTSVNHTLLIGQNVQVYGLSINGKTAEQSRVYDGIYQVANTLLPPLTTRISLVCPMSTVPFANTTLCGGVVLTCTDLRLHFTRVSDYANQNVSIVGAVNRGDISYSVPCVINNTANVNANVTGIAGISLSQFSAATGVVADDIAFNTGVSLDGLVANNRSYYNVAVVTDRSGTLVLEQGGDTFTFAETRNSPMIKQTSAPLRITSASRAGTVVTYTTQVAHNLQLGQIVIISGLVPNTFNQTVPVASVPSATTFTANNPVNLTTGAATIFLDTAVRDGANETTYKVRTATITNIARTALGVTTITTSAVHNFVVGDSVTVNAANTACNGTGYVTSVTTVSPFTVVFTAIPFNFTLVASIATTGTIFMSHNLSVGLVCTVAGFTGTVNQTAAIKSIGSNGTFTMFNAGTAGAATGSGTLQCLGTVSSGHDLYAASIQSPAMLRYFRYRFILDPVAEAVKRFDIINITRYVNIGRITFAVLPTFVVGDTIVVSGSVMNGTFGVSLVDTTANSVYVVSIGTDIASALSTGVALSTMSRFYGMGSATSS